MSSDPSPSDFTPPTIEEISKLLPAYEVLSFIAKGGMGAVYLANQKSLDRPVAIKILPRHFGEDAEFRASFEAEAKSMAKLNHPNLIGIYDFGQVDGMLYIIMEMVQGKSLYHSAYGKTIDSAEAARIVRDICRGLSNAHKHGILHRDIKPANILLDPSASPKIGDFGLARPVGEHEKDSAFGTPGYTAPEVLHNPQAVDESTDIYAVGILLYELLTSELPERAYSPVATRCHCNPKFDQIIRKAIHPTPALRFRSAEAMADALEPLTKEDKTNNPLLTANQPAGSAGGPKSLVTATTSNAPLQTQSGSSAPTGNGPATPMPQVKVGSNVPFIRNIIIIIALLAAIVVAWEGLKQVKIHRANKQAKLEQKKEEEKLEKERQRKELAAARAKARADAAAQAAKAAQKTPLPPVKVETPREALSRLRPQLIQGNFNALPKGSLRRDTSSYFFVSEKMTWHAARAFCEFHGGHLATTPAQSDLAWLCSQLGSGDSIWLGAGCAGRKQWTWIDGSPWTFNTRSSSNSVGVTVDDTEVLMPVRMDETRSFFIEWNKQSQQSATIESQLKRCADSIPSGSPEFPAGTVTYDGRNYLLVGEPGNWTNARRLAQLAGGVLAVPSNADENQWLLSFAAKSVRADEACWIGGFRSSGKTWQWATGEPWSFAHWAPGAPDTDTSYDAACGVTRDEQWQDFPADTEHPFFLIEWSQDNQGHKAVKTNVQPTSGLAPKQKKCAVLIETIKKKYEKLFTSNIKGYEADLRSFQRSLPKSQQTAYTAGILEMQSRYVNNRIPDDLSRINMPAKLQKILDSRLAKQTRHSSDYYNETETIREKYRISLFKTAEELKAKGLTSSLREVEKELENTKTKGTSFVDYILESS
ncbi:protein kinase [Verrucomicrobiaceae bacterium N1E253]|uniref:Protein kinase n=1 Tax=Oceaniferula marina TaxID=2748318 RepID=A0A851GCJ6_9BACT|nr:protein kinase [Oceaniferula marina]NWK54899.1 protein kinase [Oceaniferula marina]